MIEIKEIIWKKDELNDFEFAECNFEIAQPFLDLSKLITINQFPEENYFCISINYNVNNKEFAQFLNTDFNSLIKYKGNNEDYEFSLFDIYFDNELFDTFTTEPYLFKHNEKCGIRIQIDQDFILDSFKWKKYSPEYIHEQLIKLGKKKNYKNFIIEQGNDDTEELVRLLFICDINENILIALKSVIKLLPTIEADLQKQINSETWIDEFETNEKLFSTELILPLLRRMEFINVRYNHGIKEFGRDFLFAEINKFGETVNFGMQIKAGNISGKVNSEIDIIIGQINDAFSMPFNKLGDENDYYITTFIVAISGYFKDNAKDKIMELIEKYWNK